MIQHIVLFTPRRDLSADARREFAALVLETLRTSPHLARCTVGRRTTVDAGYDRSFGDEPYEYAAVLEFVSREMLIAYLRDPSHAKLGKAFWDTCDRTTVCEIEAFDASTACIDELVT